MYVLRAVVSLSYLQICGAHNLTSRSVTNPRLSLRWKDIYREVHTSVIHMGAIIIAYYAVPLMDIDMLFC